MDEIRAVAAASAGPVDPRRLACEQIFHDPTASATVGIWRFADGDWSVILKALRHQTGRSPRWQSGEDEGHWYSWRREALAYSSALPSGLMAPLRAPRCYGVFDRPDGSVGLWLEDLGHAAPAAAWSLNGYRSAAFALGAAQGRIAASGDLPSDRWLARHWLRRYVERRGEFVARLDDRDAWRLSLVAHHLPSELSAAATAIWEDRERLLAIVEAGPQTLCHLDLHPGNLFAAEGDTVLIDWGSVGVGALGEDAGNLIFDALFDFFVPAGQVSGFEEAVDFWILPAMLEAAAGANATLNGAPIEECFAQWAPVVPELIAFARRV